MAHELIAALVPSATILPVAVALDLTIGDPVYAWHPIRLIGRLLSALETALRRIGFDGYGGGVLLFVLLTATVLGVVLAGVALALAAGLWVGSAVHLFLLYSLLALGDLVQHVRRIERAVRAGDLDRARAAVSALVGRDTGRMDAPACRRAAVESLGENLTDGFVSPIAWYVVGGLPGLIVFKIVSTMDSMVGYRSPKYLRFGRCGARLDDAMNYVPARLTWLIIVMVAAVLPGCSAAKAWTVGLGQHAVLPGPNSGWSEAGSAGALQRRIVGPVWLNGTMVTDQWIGDASDPPLGTAQDVTRAIVLTVATGLAVAAMAVAVLATF